MTQFKCVPWVDFLNEGLCHVFSTNCSESFIPACPVQHVTHGGLCLKWHCTLDPAQNSTIDLPETTIDDAAVESPFNYWTTGQVVGFVFLAFVLVLLGGLILVGFKRGFVNIWTSLVNGTIAIFMSLRGFIFGRWVSASLEITQDFVTASVSLEIPTAPPMYESTAISEDDSASFHSLEEPMDVSSNPPQYSDIFP